jgi:hypothetical protein
MRECVTSSIGLTDKKLPGQDSGYTMVVVMSLTPIGLHRNCRHQISHLMVHLEALQVPSIQADI